jgi:Holliday junction resolvase RusA-like endonuclease
MTKDGKALKEQYQWEAKSQWQHQLRDDDIALTLTIYFGTKGKADLDNCKKLRLDALTGIVYIDDSQIADLRIIRAYDKDYPRFEMAVATA